MAIDSPAQGPVDPGMTEAMAREVKALEMESATGADGDLDWKLAKDLSVGSKGKPSSEDMHSTDQPSTPIRHSDQPQPTRASSNIVAEPATMAGQTVAHEGDHSQQGVDATSDVEQQSTGNDSRATDTAMSSAVSNHAVKAVTEATNATAPMILQPLKSPLNSALPAQIPQHALNPLSRVYRYSIAVICLLCSYQLSLEKTNFIRSPLAS